MSALVWVVLGIVLVIAEMFGGELVLLMLAGGAFAAAGVDAAVDPPLWIDFVVFSAVAVLLLGAVRPVAKRHLLTRPRILTNMEALPGKPAMVLERVDDHDGRVKIGGEIWSARTEHPTEVFDVGTEVMVVQIDGATAVVARC
ncbi:NfeD family protein [Gordonia sp. TBRC 11910]|uniref:NfeD family protein n=1 Tax=Gordonia asplenii TaxID=2725283 RepID=A0A848KY52_9ACTN|nr:NfeD family protein [Gordonia asplenii]NMO00378.1 NfeD family protein [Gordonia asplenii]